MPNPVNPYLPHALLKVLSSLNQCNAMHKSVKLSEGTKATNSHEKRLANGNDDSTTAALA